jgi:lysozyme
MLHGIDVSHHNGKINWGLVKADFVFMKASEGKSYVDSEFRTNWAAAKAAGIPRGAYHFFRQDVDPNIQAALFLGTLNACGGHQVGDLPCVIDWETDDSTDRAHQIANAKVFMDAVEKETKCKPIIYSGLARLKALALGPEFADHPLWLARYGVSKTEAPLPWKFWTFWQYSEHETSGIGPVDANQFQGSLDDLKKLLRA